MTSPKAPNSSQTLAVLLGGGGASKSNRWGVVSVVLIGVTLVLLAFLGAPLLRLGRAVPDSTTAGPANPDDSLTKFDESMTAHVAQVNGRHAFTKPLARRPDPKPDTTLVKATRYDGPAIIAMVNGSVWFSDGQRLQVGESSKDGDLKVVALHAPWSARIAWRNAEFDVEFFQHSPLLTGKLDSWRSSPGDDMLLSRPPSPGSNARADAPPAPGGLPGTPPPRGNESPVEAPPPPSAPQPAAGEPEPAPATPVPASPTPSAPPSTAPATPPPSTPPAEPEKTPA